MEYTEKIQTDTILIFIAGCILLCFILVGIYLTYIRPFLEEREYIIIEINRSCNEKEYQYWKSELRRLWLRQIPIIGKLWR